MIRLAVVLLLLLVDTARAEVHERQWWVMASPLRVVIVDSELDEKQRNALFDRCHQRVVELDALLNIWVAESPLLSLNASAGNRHGVAPELAAFVLRSQLDFERTGGAFDVSVGSWRQLDPDQERPTIGMDRVRVESVDGRRFVTLPDGYALDPGGNAKGMAVDAIVAELRAAGIGNAFVDFGSSSLYGLGNDPEGRSWQVALSGLEGTAIGVVELSDRGLSVSRSWLEDLGDGSRRFHIFDPRDGRQVTEARMAVVISPSALDAEVISTAFVVGAPAGVLAAYEGADGFALVSGCELPEKSWFTPAR